MNSSRRALYGSPPLPGQRTHPARLAVLGRLLAAALLALGGCEARPAGEHAPSQAAFERDCASLPPADLAVATLPIVVDQDHSRSFDGLTRMYEQASPLHHTLGLTQAQVGHRTTIEVRGLRNGHGDRVCMQPTVRVELFMQPLTVFVARELATDACRQGAVLDHEMRHVAVYRRALDEAAAELRASLQRQFGGRRFDGTDPATVQRQVEGEVGAHLDAFLDATGRTLRDRQAAVDSPQEYARVEQACSARPPR